MLLIGFLQFSSFPFHKKNYFVSDKKPICAPKNIYIYQVINMRLFFLQKKERHKMCHSRVSPDHLFMCHIFDKTC